MGQQKHIETAHRGGDDEGGEQARPRELHRVVRRLAALASLCKPSERIWTLTLTLVYEG